MIPNLVKKEHDLTQFAVPRAVNKNEVSSQAVNIEGEWFIPMSLVINNPEQTIRDCEQFLPTTNVLIPTMQKQEAVQREEKPQKQQHPANRFKWSEHPSMVFAYAATLTGISQVKPRTIEKFFPRKYKLNAVMIGSHL